MKELKSPLWTEVIAEIRRCHLSTISDDKLELKDWENAFNSMISALYEERKLQPVFAAELDFLTEDTGIFYDWKDILEEYFDYLEENKSWDTVVTSCDTLLNSFVWKKSSPSQYLFRKGNALMKAGKLKEAEEFGKKWLKDYPNDLYAAASNSFLLFALGKKQEALDIAKEYLGDDLLCENADESIYMAAVRLLELTKDSFAKERVAQKIAEYEANAGIL